MDGGHMIRPSQAAKIVGVHYRTMMKWIHGGLAPHSRLPNGFYRIDERWARSQVVPGLGILVDAGRCSSDTSTGLTDVS
jgi:hypothetical protein